MAFSTKSREEIETLKKQWLADGIWDIETTEGFEAHHDELLAFRLEHDKKHDFEVMQLNIAIGLARAEKIKQVDEKLGLNNLALAEIIANMQERLDNQGQFLQYVMGALLEITASFPDEAKRNEAWQACAQAISIHKGGKLF